MNKSIVQVAEKQPRVLVPETPKIQDKVISIPNYVIPPMKFKNDSGPQMVERKTIQDVGREIPIYPDPVYRLPPEPVKSLYLRFLEDY